MIYQCRDFLTELCCNTIVINLVSVLFTYCLDPYFILKLTIFQCTSCNIAALQAAVTTRTKGLVIVLVIYMYVKNHMSNNACCAVQSRI